MMKIRKRNIKNLNVAVGFDPLFWLGRSLFFSSTYASVQAKPMSILSNSELKNVTESQNLDPWFVSGFTDGERWFFCG